MNLNADFWPSGLFKTSSLTDRNFLRLIASSTEIEAGVAAVIRESAKWRSLPKGWTQESVEKFWDSLTGEAKHKVTKCIKKMEGKFDDPGAFCASLADRVDPGWRSRRAAVFTPVPEIDKAIEEYVVFVQETLDKHHEEQKFHDFMREALTINWGRKYARILKYRKDQGPTSGSAFGFIDRTNGDILKAATWNSPAKHARGNVLNKSTWAGSHSPYGMAYLRSAGDSMTASKRVASKWFGRMVHKTAGLLEDAVRVYDPITRPQQLDWKPTEWVNLHEWVKIMRAALKGDGGEYNNFNPVEIEKNMRTIPGIASAKFLPAREGSVCVYIKGPKEVLHSIMEANKDHWSTFPSPMDHTAEEADMVGGALRLWWD